MLAHIAKSGVSSTLERIFKASGYAFNHLEVKFLGSTAGIMCEKNGNEVTSAVVLFPFIDETKDVSKSMFNNFIGYALHELGHAWFTDNDPWDRAVRNHGKVLGNIINGLEDPRIERMVYESGYAPNARFLFENLLNSVLAKKGYVTGDDVQNIPFLLAVEGRRLNGYQVNYPSPVDESPYSEQIKWALAEAQKQTDTQGIVRVAYELYKKLITDAPKQGGQGGQGEQGEQDEQGDDGESGVQGDSSDQGDKGNQGDESDSSDQGDEGDEGDGCEKGDQGDQGGEGGGEGDVSDEGEPNGDPSNGKFDGTSEGDRQIEPSDFIEDELKSKAVSGYSKDVDVGKPIFETFNWE